MKMSSVRGWHSLGGGDSAGKDSLRPLPPDVVKAGYLKKFKTMKKKFFVLRGDSIAASARLEYYDSEKKFRTNQPAKRSITLKTCFNINRRCDARQTTRQKQVIALYTKNDCFCVVLETEEELEEWLKALLSLQQGKDMPDGQLPKPTFEHVWQVNVQKKELGNSKNILGPYHLCLTDRTLTLVKKGTNQQIEFNLQKIRRCGHLESFFYMEVGQATVTGPGNLWMQTEDPNIAQCMHDAILSAMTNRSKKDFAPNPRIRSGSANEASKPITVIQRWPTHADGPSTNQKEVSCIGASPASVCDSTHSHSVVLVGSLPGPGATHRALSARVSSDANQRRHSVSVVAVSGGGGSCSHHRTYSFPLSPLPPSRRASTGTRPNIKKHNINNSLTGGRDRCDSLPGRARTTSEGAHHHPSTRHGYVAPINRPISMYIRGISHSPPVGSSPVSPASGACSTDSAGSSLSMDGDAGEGWCVEVESRYGHSLTPDEPVIIEENSDDYAPWSTGEDEKLNNYMLMGVPNQSHSLHKYSVTGFKSSSPSQGSFMDVYSPCGSSPLESTGAYMPMSPGDSRPLHSHSRGSSLAEEGYVPMAPASHDCGYVHMDHGNKRGGDVSSGSSCSITSGTPSTDIRFSEYNLERVSTLISTEDVSERPARAYSVGSRPVNINNTTGRIDAVNQPEPQRVRAFSVGSRVPRTRPPHLATPTRHSSHSSVEPSDDLMEMDFTRNSKPRSRNKNTFKKPATSISSERLTLPSGSGVSSAASSYSTAEGSYMEMSPRSSPKPDVDDMAHLAPSPPKSSRFMGIIGRSPPKSGYTLERKMGFLSSSPPTNHASPPLYRVPEADSGYVEMTTGSRDELMSEDTINNLSSSMRMTNIRPKSPSNGEYMEMKPGGEAKPVLPKSSQPRVDTFPVNESRCQAIAKQTPTIKQPLLTSQSIMVRSKGSLQEDYLDMNLKRKLSLVEDNNNSKVIVERTAPVDTPKKAPEGYVEMSWSQKSGQRKASFEGKSENEDYLNMSGSSGSKRDRRGSRKDRNRYSSQPIAIQPVNKEGQTTSPVFAFCSRKLSTGTPPKTPSFLPLNSFSSSSPYSSPFSSLGRNRNRKMARRDSKESTTGSGLTTPSGSTTTIFPLNLNSPGSPMKPFTVKQDYDKSMCSVDSSSGTVKLSVSNTLPEENDYVNFVPGGQEQVPDSDYASIKPESPQPESPKPIDRLVTELSNLSLESISISEVNTRLSEPSSSAVERDVPNDSARNQAVAEPAAVVSRTSSVSSVGEKELHYASLDLDDGSGRGLRSQTSLTESSSASSPSPNVAADPTFTYAEIDFVASQKLLRH